jgi:hypothetical protein
MNFKLKLNVIIGVIKTSGGKNRFHFCTCRYGIQTGFNVPKRFGLALYLTFPNGTSLTDHRLS